MNPMDPFFALLWREFSGQTLASLRAAAEKEFNGTTVRCIREKETGRRLLIVACLTGAHEIQQAEKWFDLASADEPLDWSAVPLIEAVGRIMVLGDRFGYFGQGKTLTNSRLALVLIAQEPRSITKLEEALGLDSGC